jgi:solute carrier family 25 folate transporter 32
MSNSDELDENSCNETSGAAWKSMVAGAGAGTISTILCAPLDVVKVRMQIQGSLGITKYSGNIVTTLKNIHIEEGIGGLFKGVGPALFTVPVFWSVYWPIYDKMKARIDSTYPNTNTHVTHLVSAVVAGGTGDIITNPFWVTRTRIQALILHKHIPLSAHVNMVGMMQRIYREEGFRAFYKGLGASFLGLSHVAIQFPLCEFICIGF